MQRLALLIGGAAIFAGTAAVAQEAPEAEARTVQIELRESGRIVAAPALRVEIGRPTAVSMGDYSVRLRVTRAAASGGGPAPYLVRSSLYRSDSGWALVASPAVTVVEGEQARLRIAGNDGSDLSLAVLVR